MNRLLLFGGVKLPRGMPQVPYGGKNMGCTGAGF